MSLLRSSTIIVSAALRTSVHAHDGWCRQSVCYTHVILEPHFVNIPQNHQMRTYVALLKSLSVNSSCSLHCRGSTEIDSEIALTSSDILCVCCSFTYVYTTMQVALGRVRGANASSTLEGHPITAATLKEDSQLRVAGNCRSRI